MINIEQIGPGIWHVKKFFPDSIWDKLQASILNLPNSDYNERFEPMRNRLELFNHNTELKNQLFAYANSIKPQITALTNNNNLKISPGVVLWRDFEGYRCMWHPDDYTQNPTVQIYIHGEVDQGTSFKIDHKEITLPFVPNSGYLMDNQFQPIHGMLTYIRQQVRQSIYLIY